MYQPIDPSILMPRLWIYLERYTKTTNQMLGNYLTSVSGGLVKLFAIVVVQLVSLTQLFVTLSTAACKAPLSSKISLSLFTFMSTSIKSVIPSNHLILCCPFSFRLQSFPALASFSKSWLLTSGGQSNGASVSTTVLPMNMQG